MQFKTLGIKGPKISMIGFGAWAIGGRYRYGWGPSNDVDSIAAIHAAAEAGINWIDTAPIYGYGHSERLVGKAIKNVPMMVATKCGLHKNNDETLRRDLSARSIRIEVDDSLKRLQVDCIDFYQCHWPDPLVPLDETWECMSRLVEEGKVRWIGVSNFDSQQLISIHKLHRVDLVQPPYNLLRRSAEKELLPTAQNLDVGVIAYSPMQSGLLSGAFDIDRLSSDDWRRKKDQWFQYPNLSRHLNFVESLRPIATTLGSSVGQLAVSWVLSNTAISAAIVGARNAAQVRQNIRASDLTLDCELLSEIERISENFYPRDENFTFNS